MNTSVPYAGLVALHADPDVPTGASLAVTAVSVSRLATVDAFRPKLHGSGVCVLAAIPVVRNEFGHASTVLRTEVERVKAGAAA